MRSRLGVHAKYDEFLSFMHETLDIDMGPERILSLAYFADQFAGFIPIQRGADPDRLLRRLRAAAWDVLLLRLPAQLLGMSHLNEVVLGYVCTGDRALKQVAEVCKVEAVMALAPGLRRPLPIMSYDHLALKRMVGNEAVSRIIKRDTDFGKARMLRLRLSESRERISYKELLKVIDDLEAETVRFCKS